MNVIEDFKASFPQYKDVPNAKLGATLYEKYYKDKIDPITFSVRAGIYPGLETVGDDTFKAAEVINQISDEAQRTKVRDAWADNYIRQSRKGGGILQRLHDTATRIGNNIPVLGSLTDELNASTSHYLMGADYNMSLALERAANKQASEAAKGTTKLGSLPGVGDVTVGDLEKLTGIIGGAAVLPGSAVNSVRGLATTGAVIGGAEGVAQGEGVENRLWAGAEGTLLGSLAGAGIGKAINSPTLRKGAKAIANSVSSGARSLGGATGILKPKTVVEQRLLQSLQNQGMTPNQALSQLNRMTSSGKPATMADLGTVMQREARNTKVASKEIDAIAEPFLQNRAREQMDRITTSARQAFKVGDREFHQELQAITRNRKAQAKPLYDRAFQEAQPVNLTPQIKELLDTASQEVGPAGKTITQVANLFVKRNENGKTTLRTSLKELDSAKKAIDDILGRSPANPNAVDSRIKGVLSDFKKKILEVIDEANPTYKSARDVFSSASGLKNSLENGRKFLRGDFEAVADDIVRMSPSERDMFRTGILRELQKKMGDARIGNDKTGFFEKPNVASVLRATFPDEKSFHQFYNDIADEVVLNATRNKVLSGSQTAEKANDLADLSMFRRFVSNMRDGNIIKSITNGIADFAETAMKMNEKDANALGKLLFEANPAEQRRILFNLNAKYGNSRIRRMRRHIAKVTSDAFVKHNVGQKATAVTAQDIAKNN